MPLGHAMLPKVLWRPVGSRLLRATFHNWYGARRAILRAWGATLSDSARIRPSARIACPWNLTIGRETSIGDHAVIDAHAAITLGDFVTVSQHAHLYAALLGPGAEAYAQARGPAPIVVEHDAWISANTFVGPGITIGAGAILGSKSVALHDLAPWTIYGGEPARPLKPREPRHPPPPPPSAPANP